MTMRKQLRRAIVQMREGWTFVDSTVAQLASKLVSDEQAIISDTLPDGTAFRVVERALLPFYAGAVIVA